MEKNMKLNGNSFRIHYSTDADVSVINEIFSEHEYKICDGIINKSQNAIIDIGAHIGIFALYVRSLNKDVPIFCYEPDSDNFFLLKQNLKENRIKNVVASNTGVMNEAGEFTLYLQKDSHNHSFIEKSEQQKKVYCTTVEKIIKKHQILQCDLLKIDAEGAEFPIFQSLTSGNFSKIDTVFLEYHEYGQKYNHRELVQILKGSYDVQVFSSHYNDKMGMIFGRKIR